MTFVLEDDSGDEVTIAHGKEVKFIGAGGLTIDWTDTDNGTDADPYDLTFTIGTLNQDTTGTAAGLSATLAVGSGGTGATSLTDNAVLTGTGTSAITAESGLSFSSDNLTIGTDADGTDRSITFGHSTLKSIMGIDDSSDRFAINTDAAFEASNSFEIDTGNNIYCHGREFPLGDGGGGGLTFGSTVTAHDQAGAPLAISAGNTTAGTTDDIAGGSLTIAGGRGKGSGAGGDIIFQTANAGSTGSTLNSPVTALTISDDGSATFASKGDVANHIGLVWDPDYETEGGLIGGASLNSDEFLRIVKELK